MSSQLSAVCGSKWAAYVFYWRCHLDTQNAGDVFQSHHPLKRHSFKTTDRTTQYTSI